MLCVAEVIPALEVDEGIGERRIAPTSPALPLMRVAGWFLKKHTPEPTPLLPPSYVNAMQPGKLSQSAKHSSKEFWTCDEPYALHFMVSHRHIGSENV